MVKWVTSFGRFPQMADDGTFFDLEMVSDLGDGLAIVEQFKDFEGALAFDGAGGGGGNGRFGLFL